MGPRRDLDCGRCC